MGVTSMLGRGYGFALITSLWIFHIFIFIFIHLFVVVYFAALCGQFDCNCCTPTTVQRHPLPVGDSLLRICISNARIILVIDGLSELLLLLLLLQPDKGITISKWVISAAGCPRMSEYDRPPGRHLQDANALAVN